MGSQNDDGRRRRTPLLVHSIARGTRRVDATSLTGTRQVDAPVPVPVQRTTDAAPGAQRFFIESKVHLI
jgi:hypothetical protein